MRLRNIPGAREALAASALVVQEPERQRGRWRDFFDSEAPLFVEIGTGKGKFLLEMAAAHPERNFIGIEMYSSVLYKAVQRAELAHKQANPGGSRQGSIDARSQAEQPWTSNESTGAVCPRRNYAFVRIDATGIETIFAPGEVDGIYLNFSDPWPKDRHAHRRLTSDRFLARYRNILAPGGTLEFKTDNRALFEYSLEMLELGDWEVLAATRDLYNVSGDSGANAHISQITGDASEGLQDGRLTEATGLLFENIASEYEEKFAAAGLPICKLIARPQR